MTSTHAENILQTIIQMSQLVSNDWDLNSERNVGDKEIASQQHFSLSVLFLFLNQNYTAKAKILW